MTEKAQKYREIALDIHDYINTGEGVYYNYTEETLLAAMAKIDDWLEQIWLDKE